MRRPVLLAALTVAAALTGAALPHRVERVTPNDNRAPSGVLRDGRLLLRLEARLAMWHPHADDGPGAMMAAFAADDAPPSIPGPLVRVPTGTVIEVKVKPGDLVREQDKLLVIEAMKMEMTLPSPLSGVVKEVYAKPGDRVDSGDLLIVLK